MAVLNQHEKWIFLCEPHTASRAVVKLLKEQIPHSEEHGHHHISLQEMTNPHRAKTTPLERFIGFDVICTVRNPFDVLVTQYLFDGRARQNTFDQYVRTLLHSSEVNVPLHRQLWQSATTILYYEHLQDDLRTVFKRDLNLGFNQAHETKGKKYWRKYYDLSLINLLQIYYQGFMDHFGYEFSNIDDFKTEMVVNQEVRCRRVKEIRYGRY